MAFFQSLQSFFRGRKDDPGYTAYTQFLGVGSPVYTPRDYTTLAKEGYEKNVTVYRAVSLIAQSCAGIPWRLYKKGSKERLIEEHPLLDLLASPNPQHGQASFFEELISYWILSGNSYTVGVRPRPGAAPTELWCMRPDRMRVIPGPTSISGYEYNLEGRKIYFNYPDILHLKMFAATNDWYGLSPVAVAAALVDQQNEGFDWNTAILQNAGRPSGALVATGTLGNDQYERLKKIIRERYEGKKNAGKPMLLEGGIDWKQFSMTPMELDWQQSRKQNMRDIAIAIGVPPELLGDSSNKTYSNYAQARQSFYQETILPLLDKLRDRLNVWLIPQFNDMSLELRYNKEEVEALQEDRESLSIRTLAQWNAGLITMNEARTAIGFEEIPGADIFQLLVQGHVFVPAEQLSKYIELKLENLMAPPQTLPPGPPTDIHLPDTDQQTPKLPAAGGTTQQTQQEAPPVKPASSAASSGGEASPVGSMTAENQASRNTSYEMKTKQLYPDLVKSAHAKIASYFASEKAEVLSLLQKASLPKTVAPRLESLYERKKGTLQDLLFSIAKEAAEQRSREVQRKLGRKEMKALDPSGLFQKIQQKVQGIFFSLLKKINAILDTSDDMDEIEQAITDLYDTYLPDEMSMSIAEYTVIDGANWGGRETALQWDEPLTKQWLTMDDNRVRKAHKDADGQEKDLDEPYEVGGEQLMFPGDDSLGASLENTVNCRCFEEYAPTNEKSESIYFYKKPIETPFLGKTPTRRFREMRLLVEKKQHAQK